ncbi:MAG: PilZ domain-containing protein [Desulfobulbales bacterium]|nr:PilZ domain-containing protein [Desulfobulbales bacterium]
MSDRLPQKDNFVERRRFERAYFSSDDEVTGVIVDPGRAVPPFSGNISHLSIGGDTDRANIDADISNLSLGGLYLIFKKSMATHLEIGDLLILREIQATILCNLELNAGMRIRRLHNYEYVGLIGLGCEFTDLSEDAREVIGKLVEWGLRRREKN